MIFPSTPGFMVDFPASHVTKGYIIIFFGFELIAHLFASNEASLVFHSDGPTNRYFYGTTMKYNQPVIGVIYHPINL